ncbi:hypothetical protein M5K25_017116 [Dendrobium thyrsiflorum]|uniref:GST C-terminal domain-containing protein n=1 Tax=Dendrobium thyrsiflorum TaxID=117978 RepID=A0ABD0ULF6_DENTH
MLPAHSTFLGGTPTPTRRTPPTPRRRPFSISSSSPPFDPLTTFGRLLWGRSLPPTPLISLARSSWSSAWHLMMRQLAPSTPSGSYSRPSSPFPSVPAHYLTSRPLHLHLYAAFPCPWAHRALLVRALRSLESLIPVSLVVPGRDGLWEFESPDYPGGCRTLRDVYALRPGGYDGRSTVPMLWDSDLRDVICNESYGIVEFFNAIDSGGDDLAPDHLRRQIEHWNAIVYPKINNGVYRCGFAQSQEAYDAAASELFAAMDAIEEHLSSSRYLCGDTLTLADVCLFTTLIRFDLVYNVLFRCTKKKLVEYPNLHGYTRDIYQMPKVADTCHFGAIVDSYYGTLFPLNPSGIRPLLPDSASEAELLSKPHNRESLSSTRRDLLPQAA